MSQQMSALEKSELQCQARDAAELKRAFVVFWRALTAKNDPMRDPMERAKLACQKRDLQELKRALDEINTRRSVGGAAHA